MTNSIAKKVTRFALLVIAMVAAILIMSTTASAMTSDQKAAEKDPRRVGGKDAGNVRIAF